MLNESAAMERRMESAYTTVQSGTDIELNVLHRPRTRQRAAVCAVLVSLTASVAWAADANAWLDVAGRAHPILVHFPIALLAAAAFFELIRVLARRTQPSPTAIGCLILAVLGAAAAGASGWLNADVNELAGDTDVELHRWIAIGGSSAAVLAFFLGVLARSPEARALRRLYMLCLFLGAAAVGLAGHFGGELVYGKGYLLEPLQSSARPDPVVNTNQNASSLVSFERDILPIFQAECIDCHGTRKKSGKLRLDSAAEFAASPYFDEVVVAGDPDRSILIERITLPPSDRDFMPKRGEPLSPWQIETIRRWIADGAPFDAATAAADVKPEPMLDLPPATQPDIEETLGRVIAAVSARGGHASRVASGSPLLIVNYSIADPPLTVGDIELLMPAAERIVELNASGVGVNDDVVAKISTLSGLRRLNISRSQISSAALASLANLDKLLVLNVYGCPIDGECVDAIASMPSLQRVYLWQTGMDDQSVQRLRELRPDLEIIRGDEDEPEPDAQAEPAEREPTPESSGDDDS